MITVTLYVLTVVAFVFCFGFIFSQLALSECRTKARIARIRAEENEERADSHKEWADRYERWYKDEAKARNELLEQHAALLNAIANSKAKRRGRGTPLRFVVGKDEPGKSFREETIGPVGIQWSQN